MTTFFGFHPIKSILALLDAACGRVWQPQALSTRAVNVSWNSCVLYVAMTTVTAPKRDH